MKKTLLFAAALFTMATAFGQEYTEEVIHECDYANYESYPWYSMNDKTEQVVDGALVIVNEEEGQANWKKQYFVDDQVPTVKDNDYIIRVTMKGTAAGSLNCNVGDWSGSASTTIHFTDDYTTIDAKVEAVPASPSFVVFQSGAFVGTIYIKKVQVIERKSTSAGTMKDVSVVKYDFEDGKALVGWGNNSTREVVDEGPDGSKCMKMTNPTVANSWNAQAAIDFSEALTEGTTYYLTFKGKASADTKLKAGFQNPDGYAGRGDFNAFSLTTEWQDFKGRATVTGDNCKRFLFSFGDFEGDIYIDDLEIYYQEKENVGTGINTAKTNKLVKVAQFNLNGQRVNANTKGLVIKNGKKVVVK